MLHSAIYTLPRANAILGCASVSSHDFHFASYCVQKKARTSVIVTYQSGSLQHCLPKSSLNSPARKPRHEISSLAPCKLPLYGTCRRPASGATCPACSRPDDAHSVHAPIPARPLPSRLQSGTSTSRHPSPSPIHKARMQQASKNKRKAQRRLMTARSCRNATTYIPPRKRSLSHFPKQTKTLAALCHPHCIHNIFVYTVPKNAVATTTKLKQHSFPTAACSDGYRRASRWRAMMLCKLGRVLQ